MRRCTRELRTAVIEARRVRLDGTVFKRSFREIADAVGLPPSKSAVLSRVYGGHQGVSEKEEEALRPYFGLPNLKESRRNARRPRVSTDFDPDVYGVFQTIRDMHEMSNDQFLMVLLEKWEME